jgi:hypothetical protein
MVQMSKEVAGVLLLRREQKTWLLQIFWNVFPFKSSVVISYIIGVKCTSDKLIGLLILATKAIS